MHRTLLIAGAAAVLVFSGIVHGVWTDRWSEQLDLSEAAVKMDTVPMVIGPWNGTKVEMEANANDGLAASYARRYVHAATGKVVTIYLACGRPGTVGAHTPDVCYGGDGYVVETPRRFQLTGGSAETPPEFFTARFERRRNDTQTALRIFWSWRTADGWRAADNPRVAFAREPVLHKLYVIREMQSADEPIDTDPCLDFMQALLPVLQQNLYAVTEPR